MLKNPKLVRNKKKWGDYLKKNGWSSKEAVTYLVGDFVDLDAILDEIKLNPIYGRKFFVDIASSVGCNYNPKVRWLAEWTWEEEDS